MKRQGVRLSIHWAFRLVEWRPAEEVGALSVGDGRDWHSISSSVDIVWIRSFQNLKSTNNDSKWYDKSMRMTEKRKFSFSYSVIDWTDYTVSVHLYILFDEHVYLKWETEDGR